MGMAFSPPVQAKRSAVADAAVRAAAEAGLPDPDLERVVRYIRNPRVTYIAHGDWSFNGCQCPALGAGLADPLAADKFAGEWDRLMEEIVGPGFHIVELV